MSTISGVSSASSGWANMSALRTQTQAKIFAKTDTDNSGSVEKTELQGLLDDVAKKTGSASTSSTKVDELLKKMDADSNGGLSQAELSQGLQSILPPPPSGAGAAGGGGDDLFGKVDADGDSAVSKTERQSRIDKVTADQSTASTASTTSTDATSTASDDLFAKLDTNGDKSLSQDEFNAGKTQGGAASEAAGARPPPPAGGGPGGGGAVSASTSTTFDPLDTNKDGTVSIEERLAGAASTDAVQALFGAIDTDSDKSISTSESDAFVQQLASQVSALTQTTSSSSSTSTSADTSASSTDTASSSAASSSGKLDLGALARRAYEQIASSLAQQAGSAAFSAVA